jgi:E3 ubiquitin-protein ligase TRIP12
LNRAQSGEEEVSLRGVNIEALGLTFVLPGYETELKPGGSNITVTLESLSEYLKLVASATLLQIQASEAFRRGLEILVPVERLRMFAAEELESLLCGEQEEDWTYETLSSAVVAAHGYTKTSSVFEQVLRAVAALNSDQRKLFLQFVTGTPRLPLGGFTGLSPPLTVVKKDPDLPEASPDDYLPSVMTCQNYLKVPAYSSFAVLQKQLLYACTEGHQSFHLT